MEGLAAEPGEHFLAADSAADWIASLRRLLDDRALRQRLAVNGRALVERYYDWSTIRPDVTAAYAGLSG
jgi:glycosyltransferase involved in cell wall biosynthesis